MEQLLNVFTSDFCNALLRFFICIVVNWVIVDRLYYRKCRRRDFYFTFMLISVAIFFLVYFMMGMGRGKATMGVGLGLFGIFSIMRYRTDTMPVREMTYLFIIVCLSVVHAMVDIEQTDPNHVADMAKLVVIDLLVIVAILLCEMKLKVQATKLVQYDRIELVKPEKHDELKADLEQRLGIKILKIDVGGVDFLKDTAVLRITYDAQESNDVDGQFKVRKSQWRALMLTALAVIMCHLPFCGAAAQDFGIWTEAGVEKKISSRLTLDGGLELRTRDDGFGELDRWSAGVGVSYKLTGWLKASLSYSLLDDHNHKVNASGRKYSDYWGLRHRLNVSLAASRQIGNITVSLRERWQYTYRPEKTAGRYWNYTDDDDDRYLGEPVVSNGITEAHTYNGKAKSKWRNRLQLKYKLTKQWRPYVSGESSVGGSGLDKMRYSVGTEWRLTKQHIFDLGYMYQHSYKDDDDEGNRHVLGIGYTYKF